MADEVVDKKISFHHGPSTLVDGQIASGKITPADFVVTSDTDELLFIDANKAKHSLSGNAKTKADITVPKGSGLGGVPDGYTFNAGTSLDDFIKKLLLKQVPAIYIQPMVTLSGTSKQVEVGETIQISLTAKFTQNDAGALTELKINQTGVSDALISGTFTPQTTTTTLVVPEGITTYTATAAYADGAVKNDNLGQASPDGHVTVGSIVTGGKANPNVVITGVRKLFYGTGVGNVPAITSELVRGLHSSELAPTNGKVFNVPVALGQQYVIFAYPAALRDVSQVIYVETNDTGMAASFKLTKIAVQGATAEAPTADYKVYTYGMAAPAAAPMTFRVTI